MGISRRSFLTTSIATAVFARARAAEACGSGTIRIRKRFDLQNLDPADYYPDDEVITLAVFGSLIRKASDGKRWNHLTVNVEDQGQTKIRFVLVNGAKWSDGAELTANDVKYSFERIAGTTLKARHHEQWASLDRVVVTSSREGTIVLKQPEPGIWDGTLPVGCGCIVSQRAVEALADKRFTVKPGPTAGPYKFVDYTGDEIKLECNPGWAGSGKAHYETVIFKVIADEEAALAAYRAHRIDTLNVPADLIERRAQEFATIANVITRPTLTIALLGMNLNDARVKDPRIREAIQIGLDVGQVVKAAYGTSAMPAPGPVPLGLSGSRTDRPTPKPERDKARKLLAEAGVPNGFEVTVHAGALMPLAAAVATGLGDLGIRAAVKDQAAAVAKVEDVQLYLLRYTSPPDAAAPLKLFRSKRLPYSGFASEEYDQLLQKAIEQPDVTRRAGDYRSLQDRLDQSRAFVWLAQERTTWVFRKELSIPITPYGTLGDLGDIRRAP